MSKTKMEFVVEMTCESCKTSIENTLSKFNDIDIAKIDLNTQQVIVETNLPSNRLIQIIESTGKRAVLQGIGGNKINSAAVCMMTGVGDCKGVTRLVQNNDTNCIIEGTIDSLKPNSRHKIFIHEFGDLSNGCDNCGDIYKGVLSKDSIGNYVITDTETNDNGRLEFHVEKGGIIISEIIGRSLVVHDNSKQRIACGIIARSSGLFQNTKRICACDGVPIWDERNVPLAGPERANYSTLNIDNNKIDDK